MTAESGPESGPPPGEPGTARASRRTRRRLALAAALTVAGCAAATWWQVQRALHGNLLSDFYSGLWPLYGGYVIYMWWRLRRGATSLAGRGPRPDPVPLPGESDEELRAYNRYLAGKRVDAQRRGA